MAISQSSPADGAGLVQASGTASNQQFQFISSGSGDYRIKARHSGKVLDVYGRSTANGANVVQWADINGTNQQWSAVDTTGGFVKLINRNSGKALDVWEWSTDGARVSQYTDTGGTNQQWQLVNTAGGSPTTTAPARYLVA